MYVIHVSFKNKFEKIDLATPQKNYPLSSQCKRSFLWAYHWSSRYLSIKGWIRFGKNNAQ